jgi:signal transduction histidine kinase
MLIERVDAWLAAHQLSMDVVLTAGLWTVFAFPWLLAGGQNEFLVSTAVLLPLIWRRRRPALSAAAVELIAFLHWMYGQAGLESSIVSIVPAEIAVPLAVNAVTAYGPVWARRVGLGGALVGAFLGAGQEAGGSATTYLVMVGVLASSVVIGWAMGTLRRVRRDGMEALRERARLLEVERDQQARLAASAERARIAREMHDVVAHSLAVVVAQADGGRYAAQAHPDKAVAALTTIGQTARTALSETRRLLGVLRTEDGDRDARAPQPGAAGVAELVEGVRGGGLPVELVQSGEPPSLPGGVSLTVYRIVQEGLTNVLKHAGPAATARVRLGWGTEEVRVDVEDDGRGAGARRDGPEPGHGLVGMQERVALYGGTLEAGPKPGGGFAVRARLPLTASGSIGGAT